MLNKLLKDEDLILLNNSSRCKGIITRVDPRNGTCSTIDLAICNRLMDGKVLNMVIDEKGVIKPTKYGKKVTSTDHNTITVDLKLNKIAKQKQDVYLNTKCKLGRERFQILIEKSGIGEIFKSKQCILTNEFEDLMTEWNKSVEKSFKKVKGNDKIRSGINKEVKELMKEERRIRRTVLTDPERGYLIKIIQNIINETIEINVRDEMRNKVGNIVYAKNPQSEVFKIRRKKNMQEKVSFPLKDKNGVVRFNKSEIDNVIHSHFNMVFSQNPVPNVKVWKKYWECVNQVFQCILVKCEKDQVGYSGPTVDEIRKIINEVDVKNSSLGSMNNDLVKLGGDAVVKVVWRCLSACFDQANVPDHFRKEIMVLLYKHSGELNNIDNYRGIFLRLVILAVYQKWLYTKCSPVLDKKGSEYAFGGRKGRSGSEALLVLKLVEDHAKWSKTQIIIKFLDIQKNFDSMNYKKALIQAYISGLKGKYWTVYKNLNQYKSCMPCTALGEGQELVINEVFGQGLSDAVLMAWNLMDEINKTEIDVFDTVTTVEGIPMERLLFVDDIIEFSKTYEQTDVNNIYDEVFQNKNRLVFKTSKCKMMVINGGEAKRDIILNHSKIEEKDSHRYLGTIVSTKGRDADVDKTITEVNGVVNEIVMLCKSAELAGIRLHYVKMLSNACLDGKIKYGCQIWDKLKKTQRMKLNRIKINMMKRVMEMPTSTPSSAVQHDFGVIDMDLEIEMEKLILATEVLKMDEGRIAKRLLSRMLMKDIPGFCMQVKEVAKHFDTSFEELVDKRNVRVFLKKKIIEIQGKVLFKKMIAEVKTGGILLNFQFNGKMMKYLTELPFENARIVFMFRAKMFKTKVNYKTNWDDLACMHCGQLDTDEHLFKCSGYSDLITNDVHYAMFFILTVDTDVLNKGADVLLKIYKRLELFKGNNE